MKRKLVAVAVVSATVLFGDVRIWSGGSGDFSMGSNWSGSTVPGILDDALFNSAGVFTVTVPDDVETFRLQFDKAGLNADLNIAPGKVYTVGTNFIVKGGTAASPTRLTLGSGMVQMRMAQQNHAPGVGAGFTELVITNASLLGPASGYFPVSTVGNCGALIIGPGGYYYGPQILTADLAQYSSNRIVVAGANARLVCNGNAQIRCGIRGFLNATIVTNGGYVSCGTLAIGANLESRSNTVYVASGGVIEIAGANLFAVGSNGYENKGLVDAGGLVLIGSSSASLYVGGNASTARDSVGYGNELVVRGGGIVTNKGTTCLGGSSVNGKNSLVVTNGGYFYTGQNAFIGELGRSNSVYVADNGRFDVAKDLYVGNGNYRTNAWNNLLVLENGGAASVTYTTYVGGNGCSNELTVATGGMFVSTNGISIGVYASATGNVLRVTGGTVYTPGYFFVGDLGSYNRAVISGGLVTCGTLNVGRNGPDAVGNELVVEGGTLQTTAVPFIGNKGWDNSMTVRDAGVYSGISNRFVVGQAGSVNSRLNVCTGGYVLVKGLLVGDGAAPTNAVTYICGANARIDSYGVDSGDDVRIGAGWANGSRLQVYDGGVLDAGAMTIGVNYSSTATNCQMFVRNGTVYATNTQVYVQLNGILNIAGSNSLVKCRNFMLRHGAAAEFEIPRFGMLTDAPLIQVSNNVTIAETPSLKITCSDWVARTGGKIVLMEYAGALSGNLATLVSGAQIDDPVATVSIVGKTLVLSAPRKGGTLLKLF